ncbi:MAG TPA: hypothetical protein VF507_02580 [Pyrinomonadaceae bacterium]|jgi:hypothetical protein
MGDWFGLLFILLVVAGGLYALVRANEPKPLTKEEYERRLQESTGRGLLGAGVMGLQKILEPGVEKAAEVLTDYRAGHYDGEQESGDDKDRAEGKGRK